MKKYDQSPKAIHLQHKRDLLKAEKSFLKDKTDFVKKALQEIDQEISALAKR